MFDDLDIGALSSLTHNSCSHIEPPPTLTVDQWADACRQLPPTASEPGPWKTERAPYLRGIMEALSPYSPYKKVVLLKAAQIGASETANNWLGHIVSVNAAPVLVVYPKEEVAKRWVKTKFWPMLESTPSLQDKIIHPNKKGSGNTWSYQAFPGGYLAIASASSGKELRSLNVCYVVLDEVDAYPKEVGQDGDPIELAYARTITYPNKRKLFVLSTPLIKGHSPSEAFFLKSDQRRYFVPCPFCNGEQTLVFEQLQWELDEYERPIPDSMVYECEHCKKHIPERYKTEMVEAGTWQATAVSKDPELIGFHINALYSPWVSFSELAYKYLDTTHDPAKLRPFVNLYLGEPFEEILPEATTTAELKTHLQSLKALPEKVLFLTAGVDVQKDRLVSSVIAWGAGYTSWVMDYRIFLGNPAEEAVWQRLDRYLRQPWQHELNITLNITRVFIDSGYLTDRVYEFVSSRLQQQCFAIKGSSLNAQPIVTVPKKIKGRPGVRLYQIGVDSAKSLIHSRLKLKRGELGYIHFSDKLPEEYYEELCSEYPIEKNGRIQWQKKKKGDRNEALDCFVYALAAAIALKPDFRKLEENLNAKPEQPKVTSDVKPEFKRRPNPQVPKNFVHNW